ncbi:MAG: RNA-binding protein [Alphaproteobacteria bacterium]|nr:RNA-binding protein [Alphaproteobacteria bacterium]
MARRQPDADDGEDGSGEGDGNTRRCVVSGDRRAPERMLRFVVAPDGQVVPDVDARLPGRGIWLSAGRDMVNKAVAKNLFAKAARTRAVAPPDLADRVEALLVKRCLELLGLARRAGKVLAGWEQVRAAVKAGQIGLLVEASDGAAGGRGKVRALAPDLPVITLFGRAELGAALGREQAVHVAVAPGRLASRLLEQSSRLAGFRTGDGEMGGQPQARE